jgi:hypothetical protein
MLRGICGCCMLSEMVVGLLLSMALQQLLLVHHLLRNRGIL